jgi:hypothetical protein
MRTMLVVLAAICVFLTWDSVTNKGRYFAEAEHALNGFVRG